MVESYGQLGQTSVTYKMEDDKKIIISKDRYSAKPKIIRVGTK
ncbi:G5 domain-containing protein [Peptoanaerobacter stomatis]